MQGRNKLPLAKRAKVLELLCEGMSMRAIERVVGCSINTVDKLLREAGTAAAIVVCSRHRNRRVHCKPYAQSDLASSNNRNGHAASSLPTEAGGWCRSEPAEAVEFWLWF